MGGDLRKIARLLQDKGRKGDTILAHINPREAALLREQGGAGTVNPETGLPEFYDDDYGNPIPQTGYENVPAGLFEGAAYIPETTGYESVPEGLFEGAVRQDFMPEFTIGQSAGGGIDLTAGQISPKETFAARGAEAGSATKSLAVPTPPVEPSVVSQARPSVSPPQKGFLDSLSGADRTRLGLAGIQGLSTALMARKAQAGAQRGAEQIRQVGAPYAQRGLAEQSAAQRGELTPVGQQQLDAMRARAAQAGVARGGVGVAQQQRAEEDLRQRLNAARESFGLQLSQIGDKYTMDAIRAGMQADAEVNQLYNQMFGNLARIAAPAAIQAGSK
jgi:hypothetical protein